jgi:hypothetical protein
VISIIDIARVLQSVVLIVSLLFIFFRYWAEARLDAFRQEMFIIRDELFDYAAAGHIGFDDPAYRLLRRSMNGFIRYAHQLSFFRLCITAIELKLAGRNPETWSDNWLNALKRVTPDVRNKLEELHDHAMNTVATRLLFGSPVLLALVIFSLPILALRLGWLNLKQILMKAPIFTVSHVVDTRMIENQAAAAAPA